MPTIANLSVGIGGDAAQLDEAITQAKSKLASLGASLGASLTQNSSVLVRWPAAIGGVLGSKLGAIGGLAGATLGAALGKSLSLALSGIGGVFKLAFKGLAATIGAAMSGVTGVLKLAVKGISSAFGAAYSAAKAAFGGIVAAGGKMSLAVFDFAKRSLGLIVEFAASWLGPFELIFTTAYNLAAKAAGKVVEFFAEGPSKLGELFSGQVESAAKVLSEIAEPFTSILSEAVGMIGKEIAKAVEEIGGFAEPILQVFQPVFDKLANVVGHTTASIVNLLRPALKFVVELSQGLAFALKEAAEAAVDGFQRMAAGAGSVVSWLKQLVSYWLDLEAEWPHGGEVAILALKKIGEGVGYVIDAFRAAPSYIAEAAGQIVEKFGPSLLEMFAKNVAASKDFFRSIFVGAGSATDAIVAFVKSSLEEFNRLVTMISGPLQMALKAVGAVLVPFTAALFQSAKDEAAALNDAAGKGEKPAKKFAELFGDFFDANIGPKVDKAAADLRGAAAAAGPIAQSLKNWGVAHRINMGETAAQIGGFFDGMLKRFQAEGIESKPRKKEDATPADAGKRKPNRAVELGTKEAFEIIHGAQGDKMYTVANKQLAELIKMVQLLQDAARKKMKGGVPLVQRGKL